ncbi:MAG: hypothetical protein RL026_1757 [Pseudomonadota bacterium]
MSGPPGAGKSADVPAWVARLSGAIRARLGNTFILHGNVHDVMPDGRGGNVPVTRYLAEHLFGRRDVVIEYQRANGPMFHTPESHRRFTEVVEVVDLVHRTDHARSLPRDPLPFLSLLDAFLQHAVRGAPCGVAVLLPYAESLIPEGAGDGSAEDRAVRVFIQKWASDPVLLAADVTLVLLTELLPDLGHRIVRSPRTIEVEVGRPDAAGRETFLRGIRDAAWFASRSDLAPERLASLTSGLTRIQLQQIVDHADERGVRLDLALLRDQKKTVIEAECFGLLEYVESERSLDMVAGHEGVKRRMRRAATAINAGRLQGVPMGYLIAGPVGSAKSFLVNCFAGEIGFPCVKFLNFRSQWQGVTEGNLEKILGLLRAMWPVGVIIDEADAFLGDRNQQGDSGTSNRVFAQLATFMANTEYRGRIVWFLITSRPDLLPIDLKRQGRAEEHLALFYPESDAEYDELFRIMLKKAGLQSPVQSLRDVVADPAGLSGADIEAILARAVLAVDEGSDPARLDAEALRAAFADFVPASSPLERELQILVAVQECTSREVLPEKYRDLDRTALRERINQLRALLAE